MRHLDAIPQFQGLEVSRGHAAHHGECDGLLVVSAGDRGGAGGGAQRAVLAPEVQFVAGGQLGIEYVVNLRPLAGDLGPLPGGVRAEVQRREERRAGDPDLCVGLLHTGDGAGQIVIVALRLRDEVVQASRSEALPPVGVRPDRCGGLLGRRLMPGLGRGNIGALIGRSHAASRQRGTGQCNQATRIRVPFHGGHPEPGAVNPEWWNCYNPLIRCQPPKLCMDLRRNRHRRAVGLQSSSLVTRTSSSWPSR